jgi:hypothetical protein
LSVRVRNWTKRYAGSTADTLTGISFLATRFRRQAYCSKVARTALSARARSIARDAATPSLALMQVLDAEIMPRSRAAAPYDRKSSVTNRPERRRTSSVASASNSERRACCAWIGPAHRGPRPRRQQRATDNPSAHRFSDRPRQDARSHAASGGACAEARRSLVRSGSPSAARSRKRPQSHARRANPRRHKS